MDVERTAFEVFPSGVAGVSSDGQVTWFAPVIMQSLCRIKVELYPFDEQVTSNSLFNCSNFNYKAVLYRVETRGREKFISIQMVDMKCCCIHTNVQSSHRGGGDVSNKTDPYIEGTLCTIHTEFQIVISSLIYYLSCIISYQFDLYSHCLLFSLRTFDHNFSQTISEILPI